jgi:hypothetical protein
VISAVRTPPSGTGLPGKFRTMPLKYNYGSYHGAGCRPAHHDAAIVIIANPPRERNWGILWMLVLGHSVITRGPTKYIKRKIQSAYVFMNTYADCTTKPTVLSIED